MKNNHELKTIMKWNNDVYHVALVSREQMDLVAFDSSDTAHCPKCTCVVSIYL